MHVLWNSRRRVKGNRCPDGVDVLLGDIVLAQEGSRTVRAIHFEPVRLTAVLRSQSHVVEYCADVKQLGIKLEPAPFPRERSKKLHTSGVVEQQRRLRVTHQFGSFSNKLTVGDGHP